MDFIGGGSDFDVGRHGKYLTFSWPSIFTGQFDLILRVLAFYILWKNCGGKCTPRVPTVLNLE